MFRFAILAIVALRVTFCPLFCAANASFAFSLVTSPTHTFCCATCASDSFASDHVPVPLHSPCDSPTPCCPGYVCQVTLDKSDRVTAVMLSKSLDFMALYVDVLKYPEILVSSPREHPLRYDLRCGRSIRLVFESLLI